MTVTALYQRTVGRVSVSLTIPPLSIRSAHMLLKLLNLVGSPIPRHCSFVGMYYAHNLEHERDFLRRLVGARCSGRPNEEQRCVFDRDRQVPEMTPMW